MFVFTKINYLESNTPKNIYLFPILYFASVSPIAEQDFEKRNISEANRGSLKFRYTLFCKRRSETERELVSKFNFHFYS